MKASKIGFIVAGHGELAETLVETVERILLSKTTLRPFKFEDGEEPEVSLRKLTALIKKCDNGEGVIILVDLFGGTPGTLALSMLEEELLEVATGVNLPMAIAAATMEPKYDLHQAAAFIVTAGKEAIKEAGKLLTS